MPEYQGYVSPKNRRFVNSVRLSIRVVVRLSRRSKGVMERNKTRISPHRPSRPCGPPLHQTQINSPGAWSLGCSPHAFTFPETSPSQLAPPVRFPKPGHTSSASCLRFPFATSSVTPFLFLILELVILIYGIVSRSRLKSVDIAPAVTCNERKEIDKAVYYPPYEQSGCIQTSLLNFRGPRTCCLSRCLNGISAT